MSVFSWNELWLVSRTADRGRGTVAWPLYTATQRQGVSWGRTRIRIYVAVYQNWQRRLYVTSLRGTGWPANPRSRCHSPPRPSHWDQVWMLACHRSVAVLRILVSVCKSKCSILQDVMSDISILEFPCVTWPISAISLYSDCPPVGLRIKYGYYWEDYCLQETSLGGGGGGSNSNSSSISK